MPRFDGSLALELEFGAAIARASTVSARPAPRGLRLADVRAPRRPDKYEALEHRRRQAQMQARRQLDLLDGN